MNGKISSYPELESIIHKAKSLKKEQPAEALLVLQEGLQIDPNSDYLLCFASSIKHVMGDLDGAIQLLQTAVNLTPNNVVSLRQLGKLYAENGNIELAIKQYQQALLINPLDQGSIILLLDTLILTNGVMEARELIIQNIAHQPPDKKGRFIHQVIDLLVSENQHILLQHLIQQGFEMGDAVKGAIKNIAQQYCERGDFTVSILILEELLKKNPLSMKLLQNMATLCLAGDQIEKAISVIKQGLYKQPKNVVLKQQYLQALGKKFEIYISRNQFDRAYRIVEQINQQFPSDMSSHSCINDLSLKETYTQALENKIEEYIYQTKFNKAAELFNTMYQKVSDTTRVRSFIQQKAVFAYVYKQLSQDLKQFLHLDPIAEEYSNSLASQYLDQKLYEQARYQAKTSLKINSKSLPALIILGNCSKDFLLFERAADYFNQALKVESNHEYTLTQLGETYALLAKPHNAADNFLRALKINPHNDKALTGLGEIAYRTSDRAGAADYLTRALKANPNNDMALTLLGMVYMDKDVTESLALFRAALVINLQNKTAFTYLTKILLDQGKKELLMDYCRKILQVNAHHKEAKAVLNEQLSVNK